MTMTQELKDYANRGKLSWNYEDGMGGEWIRHDLGGGIDAIVHDNADETSLHITISRCEEGEVLLATDIQDFDEAEKIINQMTRSASWPGILMCLPNLRGINLK